METVYIETSIVSYLRQRRSAHIVSAARQLITEQWWTNERQKYERVISQYVLDEAERGNQELAKERLELLTGIPVLEPAAEGRRIANEIMSLGILSKKHEIDALHIATAAHYGIQYLLTWNCKHIANAKILPRVHAVLLNEAASIPIICTPEELLGDDPETSD